MFLLLLGCCLSISSLLRLVSLHLPCFEVGPDIARFDIRSCSSWRRHIPVTHWPDCHSCGSEGLAAHCGGTDRGYGYFLGFGSEGFGSS